MALSIDFASPQDPATMDVKHYGPWNSCVAGTESNPAPCKPGYFPIPFSMLPQMVPSFLPTLLGTSGFPIPALFPIFMPFPGSTFPATFCNTFMSPTMCNPSASGQQGNPCCLGDTSPGESSASTSSDPMHMPCTSSRTPHRGPTMQKMSLYQAGDSASSSFLDRCVDTEPTILATRHLRTVTNGKVSSAGVSSLRGLETSAALGTDVVGRAAGPFPVFISYTDLKDAEVNTVGALEPRVAAAEEGLCRVGVSYGVSIAGGDGDSDGLLPRLPALADRATGSGAEFANNFITTDATCFRVSERGDGRVALRGLLSGDLFWVSAKRYRAILKRRRQRQHGTRVGIGGLAAFSSPCNMKFSLTPLRDQGDCKQPSLEQHQEQQLLQLQPRQVQREDDPLIGDLRDDGVNDVDDDDCQGNSCGDEDEPAGISGGVVGRSSCTYPMKIPDGQHPAKATAAACVAAPTATTAVPWGFVPLATAGAMTNTASAKAALEAELRAVLAEETDLLAPDPSIDNSTAGTTGAADDGSGGGGIEYAGGGGAYNP